MYYYYIILPTIISILGVVITIIASKGVLYDRRGKGHKYFKRRGWWIMGLSVLVIVITCIQAHLSNKEAKEEKAEFEKLQKSYTDSVKFKVDSSTRAITDNLAISFKEQGLAYDSGKVQIRSDASKIQFTTDVIYTNLDKAKKVVDAIQKTAESILDPILPMNVEIEYEITVPLNLFSKLYPYIKKPSLNNPTRINKFKLDSLSSEEKSAINVFEYVNLHRYSIGTKKIKKNDWITIEQHNLKEILIEGTAKVVDNYIILTIWKTMQNVFIRQKDYANIQNYKSLSGWYLNINIAGFSSNNVDKILLVKILTGNPKSQKILLQNIPLIKQKGYSYFEKKISPKDFIAEDQGP